MDNQTKNETNIAIPLGMMDFINPFVYLLINIIITYKIYNLIPFYAYVIYIIGVVISLIFGFVILVIKILENIEVIKSKLPVNFLTIINSGIFISGTILFIYLAKIPLFIYLIIVVIMVSILLLIYKKTSNLNYISIMIGCFAYVPMYSANITLALSRNLLSAVLFYCIAICITIVLSCIGTFSKPIKGEVHWTIEAANIVCQLSVLIATMILYL